MNVVINYKYCMSRKNKKEGVHQQCPNKKKKGDYCGIHCGKNVLRIDEPLPEKFMQRKKYQKNRLKLLCKSCNVLEKHNNSAILIQKTIRGFIIRSIIKRIYGPAFTNPLLCKNDVDLASLETIWELKETQKVINIDFPKKNFFSFIYNGDILGYNIHSLQKMMELNKLFFIKLIYIYIYIYIL